jgi:NADH-quinone oxidoreductase subunit M
MKILAFFTSSLVFIVSLFLWIFFNQNTPKFQHSVELLWLPVANINVTLGVDGVSLFFVVLTALLFPLCLLAS